MLTDFAIISILLVIAQVTRARVSWFGKWLVPSSIIAGLLGLVGGPQILGFLPFTEVRDATGAVQLQISQYPGILITFVFATLLMGHAESRSRTNVPLSGIRSTLFYNLAAEFGQYGLAILFGMTFMAVLFPQLPAAFPIMLPAGFAGGHGTAAIFGQAFRANGWEDALSVGFAFATIGLAAAIVGGMILINIAARCGWTQILQVGAVVPPETAATFVPESSQPSMGKATVNPMALEPLGWHVALIFCVYGITKGADALIHIIIPGDYWIPLFAIAMLVGAALQWGLNRVRLGVYVDRTTMRRIGSLCADFLVAFGVASIKLSVVRDYAGPILWMSAFGCVYSVAVLFLGYWIFRDYWFERSIFTYGWTTGVVGFSVALLRVVDPQLRSDTLEDYGAAYVIIGPIELALYPLIIWACASGAYLAAGIALTLMAVGLFLAARYSCPCPKPLPIGGTLAVDAIDRSTFTSAFNSVPSTPAKTQ